MRRVRYLNLTPHEIVLFRGKEREIIPPSGAVLRVDEERSPYVAEGVEVVRYGDIKIVGSEEKIFKDEHELKRELQKYLKDEKEETGAVLTIVSLPALLGMKAKNFAREIYPFIFVAPDTSKKAVRENGKIVGVKGFVTL